MRRGHEVERVVVEQDARIGGLTPYARPNLNDFVTMIGHTKLSATLEDEF